MKIFTPIAMAGLALIGSAISINAAMSMQPDFSKFAAKSKTNSGMNATRIEKIESLNSKMYPQKGMERGAAVEAGKYTPSVIGPTSTWGDLDGPDGKVWFYSLDIESDAIEHEYYTEYVSRFWTLHIFDETLKPIATLKDSVRYEEGEKRTVLLEPLPIITKNYFNDDDKYEVVMSFGINFTPGHNHYRSVVYQINGEKDELGNDKSLYALDELICDVAHVDTADGKEEIYMSMLYDNAYIPEEFNWADYYDTPEFWEHYCEQNAVFNIYGKAGESGKPELVLSRKVAYTNFPGTQESSPMITTTANGKAYAVFNYYKEPLFNPFYNNSEDFSQREENTLVIEVYELGESATLMQTTEIPFAKADDSLLAKYYSIGDFRYNQDINFNDFKTDGKAAFYVTEARQNRGEESPSSFSYFIYNPDGTKRATVFEGAESHASLSNIAGFEPQELFITTEYGEYIFNFVDLISCKKQAAFSYLLEIDEDSDPDGMTVNLDRVKVGNTYMYVDEMRMPIDVDDYTWLRVAWLDKKGNLDHIDYINMGMNVHYAMCYLNEAVLHPEFYHSDESQEYMMLIKRGKTDEATGEEIRVEELLVAQPVSESYPDGRDILLLEENPHGALSNILPYTLGENPMLAVSYYNRDNGTYLCETYPLPLDKTTGITLPSLSEEKTEFNGNAVIGAGEIGIYNLQGIKVASGNDNVDTTQLPAGIYIMKSQTGAKKISIK